jgi:uncharacterized protein
MRTAIPIPTKKLEEFCQRWKIAELRVFGSALREDFGPDSDLDLLVTFAPNADWSLLDHIAMEEELSGIVGRKVDRVSQRAIERSSNRIRRKTILESAEPWWGMEPCR